MDAQFSFLALGPQESTASFTAYAWANGPAGTQYAPSAEYAFSASGEAMVARRAAAGTYSLELPGLDLDTGNVQVTAQGSSNHCNLYSWLDDDVEVRCYDDLGALADARYNVLITQTSMAASSVVLGYATSVAPDDPGGDITQTPGIYKFNSAGGSITLTRSSTGYYRARFQGVNLEGSNIQVTALGAGSTYCNAGFPIGDETTLFCYDANGDNADSQFTVAAIK